MTGLIQMKLLKLNSDLFSRMQALRNIGGNLQDGVRRDMDMDYLVFGNDGLAEANKNSSGKMDKVYSLG